MGERSLFQSVMMAVLVVAVCMGIYFIIDNQDLVKRQHAETQKSLERVAEEIAKLRTEGAVAVAVPNTFEAGAATVKTETAGQVKFANQDLLQPEAEDGGRRVSAVSSFSGNVNYLVNNEATVASIWDRCIDALGTRHHVDVMRYEPVLAESWEVSKDGLVYTIHLRKGVTWHPYIDPVTKEKVESKEVTADDYMFYWETLWNKDIPCEVQRTYLKMVDRLEKVDQYTFKVIWKEPYSLAEGTTLSLMPLPKHYYRPDPNWTDEEFAKQMVSSVRNQFLIGCGPYRFESWEKGKEIRLERYENYYGVKPAIKTIVMRLVKDPEIQLVEFKKGGLDVIGLMPEQWFKQTPEPDFLVVTPDIKTNIADSAAFDELKRAGKASAKHKFEKFQYLSYAWAYIGYNMRKPIFKDAKVRVALTHCVNRERIIEEVLQGLGSELTGPFVPQSPYYDKSVKAWPFDVEKAKELFAEAGWKDTDGDGWIDKDLGGDGKRDPFEFSFMIPSSSVLIRKWATITQSDMAKAGVKVNLTPIEWSVYTQKLDEGSYDVCSLLWSGGIESDPYQIWHSSQGKTKGGSNHVGYDSKEADELIEKGRRTLDLKKRVEIYHKFHQLLHRDQPYTFLFGRTTTFAQHRRYRNARVYKTGTDSKLMWVPAAEQVAR